MATFTNILITLSVSLGLIWLFFVTVALILSAATLEERSKRIYLFLAAFLAFLLSKVSGITVADVVFRSLQTKSVFGFLSVVSVIVSGVSGAVVAHFLSEATRSRNEDIRYRSMLFLGPLILLNFSDLFLEIQASKEGGMSSGDPRLIPNVTFLLCILLYAGLVDDRKVGTIKGLFRRGRQGRKARQPEDNWRDFL